MSRIGRLPITVPAGVTVTVDADNLVTVKGPKGTLSQQVNSAITVKQEGNVLTLERPTDSKPHKAMHGLYRALVHNMVVGVTDGFTKTLEGGSLEPNAAQEANCSLEVVYDKLIVDGETVWEIDKLNNGFTVLGVNYAQFIQDNL